MKCEVIGCVKEARKQTLCYAHAERLRRKGDVQAHVPLQPRAKNGQPRYWMEAHLNYQGDDCLQWPFYRCPKGYASMVHKGVSIYVGRIICMELFGQPDPDIEAAHSCGNGHLGCVNPKHLNWATRKENAADKIAHGRSSRGSKCSLAKITQSDVIKIRKAIKTGEMQRDIAARFRVSPQLVSAIKTGQCWGWLKEGLAA